MGTPGQESPRPTGCTAGKGRARPEPQGLHSQAGTSKAGWLSLPTTCQKQQPAPSGTGGSAGACLMRYLAVSACPPEPIAVASGKGMCGCRLAATAAPLSPADHQHALFGL